MLTFVACSDFQPAFSNQGHNPPDYYDRVDSIGKASFTLAPQSRLLLTVSFQDSTEASFIQLLDKERVILAFDSLARDTSFILDSTTTQEKALAFSFLLRYQVPEEDQPKLLGSFSLNQTQILLLDQGKVLGSGNNVSEEIPIQAGDSLRFRLSCNIECEATLKDQSGKTIWDAYNDPSFYRHRFSKADNLTLFIENTGSENLIYQDTVMVYRTITVE
jgi:hypothetical protein